jgi:tetratricopeptide (TPR) repeat protein
MFTLIIAAVASLAAGGLASLWLDGRAWIGLLMAIVFLGTLYLLNRIFAKRLTAIVNTIQAMLEQAQEEANRMAQRFMTKPVGSQKVMQRQLEKVIEKAVLEALEVLEQARPLYKWNLLAERQINTLKFQLYYQIKRFEEADRLLPSIFITEPITLAMKMARQYRADDPKLEKTFRKGIRKFKYEKAVLLYGLYSWILMKRKDYDQALEVLDEAKEKTEDETLQRNWQHVANQKYGLFSNSGLGEQWYALHHEAPPKAQVSKGQMKSHPLAPRGRRRYR